MGKVLSKYQIKIKAINKKRKRKVVLPKKKTYSPNCRPVKRYKFNTKPVSVKFISYDGVVTSGNIKYSYTYKGVPGGFYL
jgi:hypothetical protein